MTEDKQQGSLGKDILGLALGAVALFLGVSVVMSLIKDFPADPADYGDVEIVVASFRNFFGTLPGLFLCVGLCVFGVLLFIGGQRDGNLRHLLGILGTTLGMAILAGALVNGAGGWLGGLGEFVRKNLTLAASVPFGLIALAFPIWFAWLKGGSFGTLPAMAAGLGQKNAGNSLDVMTKEFGTDVQSGSKGVELDEKVDLSVGLDPEVISTDGFSETIDEPEPSTPLKPLYPEDVRLKGEIPAGAQPLGGHHERTLQNQDPLAPAGLSGGIAQDQGDAQQAGTDLAADSQQAADALRKSGHVDLRPEFRADYSDATLEGPADTAASLAAPSTGKTAPHASNEPTFQLPRVSFEQSELFVPEPAAEAAAESAVEPAEELAAETPESPVTAPTETESAAQEPTAAMPAAPAVSSEETKAAEAPTQPEPVVVEEAAVVAEPEPIKAEAQPEAAVEVSAPEAAESKLADSKTAEAKVEEPEEASATEAEPEEVDEPEEEYEEEEEYEYEEEEYEEEDGEPEEEEEEYEYEEEDPQAELEEEEYEEEGEPEGEEEYEEGEEEYEDEEAEEEEEYEEEETEPEASVAEEEAAKVKAEVAPEAKPEPETEPEVVLQSNGSAVKSEVSELCVKAGALVLEHQRVAVSLLQREFSLDFKQATQLLDQLQEQGLIGPYLGGQNRDILMTAEEWSSKVGC